MTARRACIALAAVMLAVSGCTQAETGDRVEWSGTLVEPPKGWVVPSSLMLRRHGQLFALFGADLRTFRAGDRVEVAGRFAENSTAHVSAITVERISRK